MDRDVVGRMLNGGYIEAYDIDMRRNCVSMRVDVLESGVLSSYDLSFGQVSSFLFETESRSGHLDDRLDMTEVWIETAPEGSSSEEWEVKISMWDQTHVTLRCSTVTVDGDVLR